MSILPLFRQEAIESRKNEWLGRPQLLRPLSATVATVLAAGIVIAIGLFLTFGNYTRRVRLTGTVQPSVGVVRLFAPQTGRLTGAAVVEAQQVREGDRLYTIGLDSTTNSGEANAIAIQQMRVQRQELVDEIDRRRTFDLEQKKSLIAHTENLRREIAQVAKQMVATMDYAETLRKQTSALEPVMRDGFITRRDYEERRETLMQQQALLESLRRDSIQIEARLLETQSKLLNFDIEAETTISTLRRQISSLEQQIAATEAGREILILAPQEGVVTGVLAQPGQTVPAGAPLLSILPTKGYLEVHFFASSSAIGFVRKGAPVLLRYAPFPYQKFGQYPGVVTDISRVALRNIDAEIAPTQAASTRPSTGYYRIRVRPERETVTAFGAPEPLQAGMDVEADLFLETRRLYEWILEPIYSLRGGMSEKSHVAIPESEPHA